MDGYRLALTKNELLEKCNDAKFIIPGKTQSEISKIISGKKDEDINIAFSENYALIEGEGITITSRLIEGEFFSYKNTIPTESKYIVKTNCKNLDLCPSNIQLAGAEIEMVSLVSRENRLKNAIEKMENKYDYIFIDFSPTFL